MSVLRLRNISKVISQKCFYFECLFLTGVSSKSKHVQKEEFIHSLTKQKRDLQTGINGFKKNEAACMIPCHVLGMKCIYFFVITSDQFFETRELQKLTVIFKHTSYATRTAAVHSKNNSLNKQCRKIKK